jgi:hypothetical protein
MVGTLGMERPRTRRQLPSPQSRPRTARARARPPGHTRRRTRGTRACAPTHTAGGKCSPMLAVMRAFWWPIEAGGAVLAQRSRAGYGASHWQQLIVAAGTDCPRRLVTRDGTDAISIRTAQSAPEPSRGAGVRAGGHPRLPSGLAVHLGEFVRQFRQRANGDATMAGQPVGLIAR